MRLFFLLLLLVNGVLAAWLYQGAEPASEPLKPLPENIQRIEMVKDSVAMEPEPAVAQTSPPPKVARCYTLGPLSDKDSANNIMTALKERLESVSLRSKQESRHHLYWVYIPALESRKSAIAMSKRLAREKVRDYYIVRGGNDNNRISLGHFKDKSHADRRIEKLKKLGFDVVIEPIYRQYELFWLDYTVPADVEIEEGFWSDLLPDGVSRLSRDCN